MKTNNYKYYMNANKLIVLWLILMPNTACDSFLEMDAPKTELITPAVFASNSTANAAVVSIYARMAIVNGVPLRTISWISGLSADEFINYSTVQDVMAFYSNSLIATNSDVAGYFWTPYYNIIFQSNAIIEGLQENSGVDEAVKKQLIGEAKFIRAFYHFYLTNFFGDIPVAITTDYRANTSAHRLPKETVYQQIITDLKEAKDLLSKGYVGYDGLSVTIERVRPNKSTAQALLSRVYLYLGEYENAEQEATEVIENALYSLPDDLNTVFLKNNPGAIWQLQPVPNASTTEANMFILTGAPETSITKTVTVSEQLLSVFEQGDERKAKWLNSNTIEEHTYVYPYKYKITGIGGNTTEYSMVFRLAEQYLIRAEARIHLNKIDDGIGDLNALRIRANLYGYESGVMIDPLSLVELERQRELFAEGHRWFDLNRTGRTNEVMQAITPKKGGTWSSHAWLLPIPQNERDSNPNLTQNSGY